MTRTDGGKGEQDQGDSCGTAGSRSRQAVKRKHAEKEKENGPQLPSEARKREGMGRWAAVAWLLTKPDVGFYYAELGPCRN